MKKVKGTTDAVEILHNRIGDDPKRKKSIEIISENAAIAQMIYDLRTKAGLTQAELAKKIGTTQSVISRLEDADYEGHTLHMLTRITHALDKNLNISITDKDKKQSMICCASF
jgi:predicted transcriptional regulator